MASPIIQSLINQGIITQEEYDQKVNEYSKNATVKIDVNNLGDSIVDLLIHVNDLEQRVQTLEGK